MVDPLIKAKQIESYPPPDLGVRAFAANLSGIINQGVALHNFITLNVTIPEAANYKIDWSYLWSVNSISDDMIIEIKAGATVIQRSREEAVDAAGTGVVLPVVGGGTADTSSNQRFPRGGSAVLALPVGAIAITIAFACDTSGQDAAMYQARLSIEKFS